MKTDILDKIPDEKDWLSTPDTISENFKFELDYMRGRFFGKSWKDIDKTYFDGGSSIERSYELTYAPRKIFQYYVQSVVAYVLSDAANGNADAASTFLKMLENRLGSDYQSVVEMYALLEKCVDFYWEQSRMVFCPN